MRQLLMISLGVYVAIVVVITVVFFVQQQIAYREHISPARSANQVATPVIITDDDGSQRSATVQFTDGHFAGAHGRMGNELLEQSLVLLSLNLLTVILLALVCLATLRLTPRSQLTLTSPVVWLRRRRGQCTHCGYDLRGSVGQECCPECGAGIEAA